MAVRRTWLSVSVELVEGRGTTLWPRPGRVFAVSKQHTFERFAVAIDDAFARWDRAHLHEFHLFAPGACSPSPPSSDDRDDSTQPTTQDPNRQQRRKSADQATFFETDDVTTVTNRV